MPLSRSRYPAALDAWFLRLERRIIKIGVGLFLDLQVLKNARTLIKEFVAVHENDVSPLACIQLFNYPSAGRTSNFASRNYEYMVQQNLPILVWIETKVMPLPDAGDFRVTLGDEEKERIKRQITAAVEASLQVASRELWQRLYEAVSHLAERLQAYKVTGEGVEHPFRDSVVTNLVKLVDVLPKLNVTGDPELERLANQVRASLLVDPQELRKSESIRSETAKAATAICDRMAAYMAGYSVPASNVTLQP